MNNIREAIEKISLIYHLREKFIAGHMQGSSAGYVLFVDELQTYINKVRKEATKKHLKKFVEWVVYKEPRELHTTSLQGYLKVYLQSIKEQE